MPGEVDEHMVPFSKSYRWSVSGFMLSDLNIVRRVHKVVVDRRGVIDISPNFSTSWTSSHQQFRTRKAHLHPPGPSLSESDLLKSISQGPSSTTPAQWSL